MQSTMYQHISLRPYRLFETVLHTGIQHPQESYNCIIKCELKHDPCNLL